jgi:hypothetical protein
MDDGQMHIFRFFALVILTVVLSGTVSAEEQPGVLTATLSSGKMGSIHVVFRNGSDRDVRVNKQVIESSILALEVRDAAGKVIAPVPPPVPAGNPEFVIIPAGKAYSRSYELAVFSPPLAPGNYRVRVRLTEWKSNELQHALDKIAD